MHRQSNPARILPRGRLQRKRSVHSPLQNPRPQVVASVVRVSHRVVLQNQPVPLLQIHHPPPCRRVVGHRTPVHKPLPLRVPRLGRVRVHPKLSAQVGRAERLARPHPRPIVVNNPVLVSKVRKHEQRPLDPLQIRTTRRHLRSIPCRTHILTPSYNIQPPCLGNGQKGPVSPRFPLLIVPPPRTQALQHIARLVLQRTLKHSLPPHHPHQRLDAPSQHLLLRPSPLQAPRVVRDHRLDVRLGLRVHTRQRHERQRRQRPRQLVMVHPNIVLQPRPRLRRRPRPRLRR